ncbi:MAG: choice-of-anchor D domain-containing protein [Chloroflexota bacterium]
MGQIDGGSNGDDGMGILTTYDTTDHLHQLTVTGNVFETLNGTANRAFYINPGTDGFTFSGNTITGGFTGTAITQARTGLVEGNTLTGTGTSATLGTWGYPDASEFGHTTFRANTITDTAAGFRVYETNDVTIEHNVVSGVTDGVTVADNGGVNGLDASSVVIRDNSFTGIAGKRVINSYPQAVDASGNWWGTTSVAASDVTGPVDFTPVLTVGTDTSGTAGFQGSLDHLKVHTLGSQLGTEGRIQEGIDSTVEDGTVDVAPGTYSETATHRDPTTDTAVPGYQFGLFFPNAKPGITVRGITAADAPITDPDATQAVVTTNATNNFGYSGIFVAGDDATIQGLEIGANTPSSNKTIEVVADGFSFLDSYLNDVEGAVYLGDWTDATTTSRIATYHIDGNRFATDNQITIANGAGHGHPADLGDRTIRDNVFDGAPTAWHISFRGAGGQAWYVYPVGGATISGNDFGPADINIRATGTYDESEFAWSDWRGDNTFARLVWVEDQATGNLRTFSYAAYTNVRQLGGRIDERSDANRPAGVQIAHAGDTVHVHSGTYPEQAIVDKAGITVDGYGATKPVVDDGAGTTGTGLTIRADQVGVSDLTVQRYNVGVAIPTGPIHDVTLTDVDGIDNGTHGLWSQAFGLTDLTIDGGQWSRNNQAGGSAGRGIWLINGIKSGITITDVEARDNGLVGIDVSDGSVTDLTLTGNTVTGNGDSGIAVLGAKGPGANLIADNTVTDNGRFGIEVKNPTGNGAASGAGSVVVSGNTVSLTGAANRAQDLAGIAVLRRSVGSLNASQPSGAYVVGNTVSGFQNTGGGDGFGIVAEGTDQTVTQNVVTGNEVGVQAQAANPSNPSGDATATGTDWFDRGNAASYEGVVTGNSIHGNTTNFRAVGLAGAADASGNWWGTTDQDVVDAAIAGDVDFTPYFHTGADTSGSDGFQGDYSTLDVVRIGAQVGGGPRIQEAIDMVTGSTVYVHAGTYVEDVDANVADLHLLGAHHGDAVSGRTFAAADEATVQGRVRITANDVTLDGFSLTNPNVPGSATGVLVTSTGHGASILRNLIHEVSSTGATGTAQAIYLDDGPDGTAITGNDIADVSSQRSAKGIYVGDTAASNASQGVSITDNVITGVTSATRGAYGIQTNNAAGATLTISGNTIDDLDGSWAHGIGIEGDAPGLTIDHHVIHGLAAAGVDKVAVFFEADASWADAEVHRNDLDGGSAAFGVALHPSLVIPGSIDASCNWWGDASGPGPVAAGTGSPVGPSVDASPWLTTSDLDGDCDGIVETVAPTANVTFDEGTAAANGGAFGDAASAITITSDASIGTFTDNGDGTWSWSLAANDPDNDGPASGTVTISATTALGATATTSFSYAITNLAPSGTFVAPAQVAVGDAFDIGFDPTTDPSAGDTFSYAFTCGLASPVSGSSATTTCAAPTSGQVGSSIHVTGSVTDDDGASSVVYEADVLVVPVLTITPSTHDFGSVQVGETSAPVTFTLTNNSGTAYDIDEVGFFVIATNHFEVVDTGSDECSGTTLAAHGSCTFEVVFTPQTRGPKTTTLGVQLDGSQAPLPKPASHLSGEGIAPAATVAPDALDFGDRDVSAGASSPQSISVTNTGDAGSTLTILSITKTGSGAFTESHGSLAPLGQDESLIIDVTFDPASVGDHDGTIVIRTSVGNFSVALSGTGTPTPGPALTITPSSYNFGDVTVGHSKSREFTVANTGTAGVTSLVVAVTGDDLSVVADDSTCDETTSLATGESCVVRVRYQPDEAGDDTGSLDATADDGVSDSANLMGSGVAGEPVVAVSPDAHEFDPVVVGDAPELQDFTVRNTGDATLTGIDIQLTGAAAFTVVASDDTDCEAETTSLAPDATCVVRIQFAPGAGGDKSATLKVLSANADNGTVNVPLSGTALAPALAISPSGYNFGDVTVDHSKSRAFTVTNTGTAPLTGLDVEVTGDDLSIVADDGDCDETTSLAAGGTCSVRVRYAPDEAGDDTGSLDATADGGLVDSAPLRGSGVAAKGVVTVTPDEGAFGSIEVGTSQVLEFTVENTGEAGLTFSSVGLTGSSTFAIEPSDDTDCLTEDATLAPGDTCVVRVRFAPAASAIVPGRSRSSRTPPTRTVNVPLNGTSTPRPSDVSVSPNPYDFGNVVFRGTKTRTFTVTNSGGTPVTITSVTRTGSSTFTVLDADNECAAETLGTDESCTFRVRFRAPSSTAGSKSGTIHVVGTGFDAIEVPVTATAAAFKAKVDAFVTDKTDRPANYVGVGVYCRSSCPEQQAVESVARGRTFTYRVRIRNNGNGVDAIRVRLYQTGSKASIQRIRVLRNGNQDVTSRVTNGSYVARDMNPGAEIYFWVKVTVRTSAVRGRVNYVQISGQSTRTSSVKDVVRAKTKVR